MDALASPNCKLLIFFRSQRSLVKSTIQRESGNFAVNGRTSSDIITVDLSHKEDMHTEEFMKSLENTDSEKFKYYANRIDGVIQSKSTNYSNPKLLNGAGALYKEYQKEKRKTKYETDKIKYHEQMSKADQILEEYRQKCHSVLRNVYRILLTRGTKGCYIFCCDPQLQKYIKEQAERFNESLI